MKYTISKMQIFAAVGAFAMLVLASATAYTVDQSERALVLTNGKITGVSEPGLSFKLPVFQSLVRFDLRAITQQFSEMPAYSRDQQQATLNVSVTFRVDPGAIRSIYENYGSIEMMATRIIAPRVNEETKGVLGQYAAIDAIQSRNRLTGDVFAALKAALVTTGIVVESVQIENIDFSQEYEKAVEEAASAKARVETARNKLAEVEQLAQQQVTQAKAAAEATRTAADASAYAVRVAGEAEAASIAARGDALRRNPELVNLAAVEKWNGVTPVSMVPGSAVPFIGVK